MQTLQTPVVLIVFNRPDNTSRVFERVRAQRPSTLLIVADGPRPDRPGEADACAEVLGVVSHVDWPCEVLTAVADSNLGCRQRIITGLNWVFEQVPEAIILEDDCLPEQTFFPYASELLERYRDDERVMMISGDGFVPPHAADPASYRFVRLPHIWGWATWARAWAHNDPDLAGWPAVRDAQILERLFGDQRYADHFTRLFDAVHMREIDTWDFGWTYSIIARGGLSAVPRRNLIANIGFDQGATHTTNAHDPLANLPTAPLPLPLVHPPAVVPDITYEQAALHSVYRVGSRAKWAARFGSLVRRIRG